MWRRVGRNGTTSQGYSITNEVLTLIVPYSRGSNGVEEAIQYLNSLREPVVKPEPRRICSKCNKPIARYHKYQFNGNTISHRDCDNPLIYPWPL